MNRLILSGCRPEPLAGYLKALGVLRLVAEQVDPQARGAWVDGVFVLETRLTADELVAFFADSYRPTPVITPWNGGSGFWTGDNQAGIGAIGASESSRFGPYRAAIALARDYVTETGLQERPDNKQKPDFVNNLRAALADEVLAWLDAALVFTRESLLFPPLLGTGGNDGRLDFANNFMQRLAEELLSADVPAPPVVQSGLFGPADSALPSAAASARSPRLLASALFGTPTSGLGGAAIGQFFPSAAGGANGGAGFDGAVGTNPWDFILLVEGALCFATAMVRRLESGDRSAMTFPFSVRAASAGFGTAASTESDSSRDELWLPLWSAFADWPEISTVFREGRSRVGRRAAVTGTDFARSLASLGVDRGIGAFSRYGFHLRNGLAYQAVPLGRWPVGTAPTPIAALLDEIDPWIVEVSRVTGKDTPARVRTAIQRLDDAIVDAVRPNAGPGDAQRLLLALADVEASVADSKEHAGLRHPVPLLDGTRWLPLLADGSPEFDLAASLASSLRARWSCVRRFGERWGWADGPDRVPPSSRVWRRGPLAPRLLDLLQREQVEASRDGEPGDAFDLHARWFASLDAVITFLERRTDDVRIAELARALSLLTWPSTDVPSRSSARPPAVFAAARLLVGGAGVGEEAQPIPTVPGWIAAGRRDDGPTFTALTWRRLTASGVSIRGLGRRNRAALLRTGEDIPVHRIAAACRFPLSAQTRAQLLDAIHPAILETP